jgi:hypothetical protein
VYFPTPEEKKSFQDVAQKPVIEWLKKNIDPVLVDKVLAAVR